MVQAIINLDEHEARVLNVVKGKYGLRNKSEAISQMIRQYESAFLEPEIRPEYAAKLGKITKGKTTRFSSVEELRRRIEHV